MHGSGNVVSETREVAGFTEVAVGGVGSAIITQGASESLVIEAEDNLLPLIETEVRDGRLTIEFKKGLFPTAQPTRPIRYHIGVRDLAAVQLAGAGNIQVGVLRAGHFAATVKGAGNITFDQLDAGSLASTISGAGHIQVRGVVATQELSITGAGDYRAADLDSRDARVTVSGAGNARVRVSDSLTVRITGAGSVEYTGAPQVSKSISGVGRIRQLAQTS